MIWFDNMGASYLSTKRILHAHTKHVDVDYHFLHERVATKTIQIIFISSKDQLADVLPKPLFTFSFIVFRFKFQVEPLPST